MGFVYEKDTAGIVTVTMDMDGQSANTMGAAYLVLMRDTLARLEKEEGLAGVIFASAKKTFFAGGDLEEILAVETVDMHYLDFLNENKSMFRRLEQLPVPVVAAINGAAMGGGYELCLGCNWRIASPEASVALPEVTLGLLPAAGGIVRTVALLGLEKALPVLLEGRTFKAGAALDYGLVDQLVDSRDGLIDAAKAWILENPQEHTQPWDKKGFKYPGGQPLDMNIRMTATLSSAMLINKTRGQLPAPEKILDIAVNSMRMGFDAALSAESRGFCSLVTTPHAKAAISTFFLGMQDIKNGRYRAPGAHWKAESAAVLGAGMMGAGISWAHARSKLPTHLKDTELANANKGKAYSENLCDAQIKRGRMDEAAKEALLGFIKPTETNDFDKVDILVEAVFEDISLKEKVIGETFGLVSETGVYGSNTSTLPISILAESCPEPERFIGIHFFSPVDKMQLVELINGEKTSPETTRKAYDYCVQIGKIPIVVNDSRGFFTSRVFSTFLDEAQLLLCDGLSPAAVERAAWKVGMPAGPFAVFDEVTLTLIKKVDDTHLDLDRRLGVTDGFPAKNLGTKTVCYGLIEQGRTGRKAGAGFYDYHADGSKTLWKGLSQFSTGNRQLSIKDAEDRLLYRQAIETLRCFDEGVLNSEVEANIGSIFGIGFPAWTGGALQYIRFVGIDAFEKRAAELAEEYGERFEVKPSALEKMRKPARKNAA
ncbi:3-hydroxyacyl-CoA dehydrogenase NAD-binding domain-containing protein [Thalassospira profundimaris]|uniref:3-hydroxyacyl-CoA dehydrogenase NAD-binding domain-containing protein n=1 Tax=Thalassospira profundimaris TaxID=502049 RepID=UPI001C693E82|nr:3-hydroxyacyl-CoA dehydrogenase NAD-binding domain-containing protein [Thalassospira profundimaris]